MKKVYIGKEGSGKTLLMARDAEFLLERNPALYKKSGVMRPIVSNVAFSPKFEVKARQAGVPIKYWTDIEELEELTECDLFIDEIGAYFDSRNFADLPLSTRLWLAQAQKLGVHIYAGAQDWGQIDVSFRRLVNRLFELKKIAGSRRPSASIPSGKYPWAVFLVYKVAPGASNDSTELRTMSVIPSMEFAFKSSFGLFDTNARVRDSAPPPLKKVVRICPEDGYVRVRYY